MKDDGITIPPFPGPGAVKVPLSADIAEEAAILKVFAASLRADPPFHRRLVEMAARLVNYADELRAMEADLRSRSVVVPFPARRHGSDWTKEDGA